MLLIGSSHVDKVIEVLDKKEYEGVSFDLVSKKGIQAKFEHNAASDQDAKAVVKKVIAENHDFDGLFISIQFTNN